jgi:nucleoside-diphosphate-sugar epimerase
MNTMENDFKGNMQHNATLVLVSGGSGFVGSHAILQLLKEGYRVRTTVRSLSREAEVRAMIKEGSIEAGDRLTFIEAELSSDPGWQEAVNGCGFVLHIASPFIEKEPDNADELIIPAREGALRVLRAAQAAGVKRVVMTSSFAAIGYGHKPTTRPFTENDWTDLSDKHLSAYVKSKTLAERAAWDFMAREGGAMELTVINPVGIFGPALGPDYSGSIKLIQLLLDGKMPRLPHLYFDTVDVRDVARLHILAMTNPEAKGQRFIASSGKSTGLKEIAGLLQSKLGKDAGLVSTKEMPDWLVRLAALFSKDAAQIVHDIGKVRKSSNEKAKHLFGWTPIPNDDVIVATAKSLLQFGLTGTTKK